MGAGTALTDAPSWDCNNSLYKMAPILHSTHSTLSLSLILCALSLRLISGTHTAIECSCGTTYTMKPSEKDVTIKCTNIAEKETFTVTWKQKDDKGKCQGKQIQSLQIRPKVTNHTETDTASLNYYPDYKVAALTIYNIRENKSYCIGVESTEDILKPTDCTFTVVVEEKEPPPSQQPLAANGNKVSEASESDKGDDGKPGGIKYLWFLTLLILVVIVAATFFIYKRKLQDLQRQVHNLQQAMWEEDVQSETSKMCPQPKPAANGQPDFSTFISTSET
eukprot:XP_004918482.1 PREDICTED: uncharacterized protein LOC101732056 [Xenopus tropicalis]